MFFTLVHHISRYYGPQSSTVRSTTEAELIACASALFGEALNLHTMIESLIEVRVPVSFNRIYNQAAITIIQSGYNAKLRHPDGSIESM